MLNKMLLTIALSLTVSSSAMASSWECSNNYGGKYHFSAPGGGTSGQVSYTGPLNEWDYVLGSAPTVFGSVWAIVPFQSFTMSYPGAGAWPGGTWNCAAGAAGAVSFNCWGPNTIDLVSCKVTSWF